MFKKFSVKLLILMMVLLASISYGNDNKDKIVVGTHTMGDSLDPAINWNGWNAMRYGIVESLVKLEDNMEIKPWIAEKISAIDDYNWEIIIKDNITFQNGKKVDGDAVKKSLIRTIELNKRAIEDFSNVEWKSEGMKVFAKTKEKDPIFIEKLIDPMYAIVDVEEAEKNSENFLKYPIGTGPYIIKELKEKEYAKLTAYDNYWDGKVNIKNLEYINIPDNNSRLMALQSGNIDVAVNLSPTAVQVLKKDKKFNISMIPGMQLIYAAFNPENEFLSDKTLRVAINMAVDKKSYAEIGMNSLALPAKGPFQPNLPFGYEKLKGYEFDKEKAKELLKNAGYIDNDGDGILEKNGKNVKIKLSYGANSVGGESTSQMIQSDLKDIGINVELQKYDKTPFNEYNSGNFDIAMTGYATASSTNPKYFFDVGFSKDASDNHNGYFKSEKIEDIINSLKTEMNPEKRYEYAYLAQQELLDLALNIFLLYRQNFVASNEKVQGFNAHTLEYYQMDSKVKLK